MFHPPNDTKICSVCARPFPRTEFRKRWKDEEARMSDCSECHARVERERYRNRRQKENGVFVQKTATRIAGLRSFQKISNLVLLMLSTLGGPDRFFGVWATEVERARNQKRKVWALHGLRFCNALFQARQSILKRGSNFTETDVEERADLQDALRHCFLEERKLVSAAARQAGCRVFFSEGESLGST